MLRQVAENEHGVQDMVCRLSGCLVHLNIHIDQEGARRRNRSQVHDHAISAAALPRRRQIDREAAALPHLAPHREVAAVRAGNVTRNRQPQPQALRKALAARAAIERVEDARKVRVNGLGGGLDEQRPG
jgi:hypothetical protein